MNPASERLRVALTSARELASIINSLTEDELRQALILERDTLRRPVIIERLVQRLVGLAASRTREELQKEFAPWLDKTQ